MLFSLIKSKTVKKQPTLYKPFILKSKFLNLQYKQVLGYKDFRLDYLPLVNNQKNYQSFIRVWYLLLALRTSKAALVADKMAIFPYRRTRSLPKHQDPYTLSINKHFYETLIEHRNIFYFLTVSTSFVDKLYSTLCLYTLKTGTSKKTLVIKKHTPLSSHHSDIASFILSYKWKFKVVEFV
jgi:hypothetical protein